MQGKKGAVVFLPDIEYKSWMNKNKELLQEALNTKNISTAWLAKGRNKDFLIRYFDECGYKIVIS
ncbi:MAG: hypothetical protein R3Y27_07035 [Clostridia bacterium]